MIMLANASHIITLFGFLEARKGLGAQVFHSVGQVSRGGARQNAMHTMDRGSVRENETITIF